MTMAASRAMVVDAEERAEGVLPLGVYGLGPLELPACTGGGGEIVITTR